MKHNFFAGPAILPREVINQAAEAVSSFEEMGLSLIEISHRSKPFVAVMEEAERLVRKLLNVTEDYAVLFLTGGASSQFFMAPMNLLSSTETAAYINTGAWSKKAIKEAKMFGNIEVIASSEDKNFNYIPSQYQIPPNAKYLHVTSNNTIFGTQMNTWPETNIPFVSDMSSDIFSRSIDLNKYDLIYAGAQKNLGPAGVTLVIVKKDILGKTDRPLPSMLNYQTHMEKQSSFNTPPVFPIYVSMLNMRWIDKNGGVAEMEKRNSAKADCLYTEIDRNSLFRGTAEKDSRSKMNVCFTLKDDNLNQAFLAKCDEANCVGLAGHRSVGGFRASLYNALSLESVKVLVGVMATFESKYA